MRPYFRRGGVTIYHGDALLVVPELAGVGAVIADPPYSSGGMFRSDRARGTVSKYVQTGTMAYRPEFAGDSRDQRGYLAWSTLWLAACRSVSVAGSVVLSFSDWRQLPVVTDAIQAAGWTWRGLGTWWKPGIRMQRGSLSLSAEYVAHGVNGPCKLDYDGAQQNVFRCAPVREKQHIAEKPAPVMAWLVSVTRPGCLILDPFCGSGATLRAARDAGHPAIGIEADERYCELAAKRLEAERRGEPLAKAA